MTNNLILDALQSAESVLSRQKWHPDSTDPEAVALRKVREAIAREAWIPVTARTPDEEPVLGIFDDGSQMVVVLAITEGWQDAESRDELLQTPTHWQPLPPPPVRRNHE